jgi:2-oxoisovalerate dehydrogenase E1 component beta subunit
VTVVSYGRTLPLALQAADALAKEGIEVEVVDLRSLAPYDWETIETSVRKTNRVLFLNEDTEVTNFGEHLLRRTVEELFYELHAPPRLLAGAHVPGIGLADALEKASVPQVDEVTSTLREIARAEA